MRVGLTLHETSQTLWFENVRNTYEKGSFYCLYTDGQVNKFPITDIFSVIEDYGDKTTLSEALEVEEEFRKIGGERA